jgi:hypothetical protein
VTVSVDFLSLTTEGLVGLSKERGLSLNAEEMAAIQTYFRAQGGAPRTRNWKPWPKPGRNTANTKPSAPPSTMWKRT